MPKIEDRETSVDIIDMWARKIAHMMYHRNEEGAIQMVRHGIRAIHDPNNSCILDVSLSSLGCGRAANILEEQGIVSVGDFLGCTIDELNGIHEFSTTSIIKCLQAILRHAITRLLELEELENKLRTVI